MASEYFVHSSSVVDAPCQIGKGTKLWHFCHVGAGAVIGENCIFGQNCFVGPGVKVGNKVKVQNNVSIYSGTEIEDKVFLGPSCVLTNVKNPRAHVERKDEFLKTVIREGATVGANATIVCGVTLGRYCLIGAGAVITSDVPDFALMLGVPATQKGWVCACGEVLRGDKAPFHCSRCKATYVLNGGRLQEGT